MTTEPISGPGPRQVAAGAPRRSRFRERSLLLNPAPVIGATLAAFAIALSGLTAQLVGGHDPAVGTLASVARGASSGATTVTTRASGAASATGSSPVASAATTGGSATRTLSTATSGSATTGGTPSIGRDDGV